MSPQLLGRATTDTTFPVFVLQNLNRSLNRVEKKDFSRYTAEICSISVFNLLSYKRLCGYTMFVKILASKVYLWALS